MGPSLQLMFELGMKVMYVKNLVYSYTLTCDASIDRCHYINSSMVPQLVLKPRRGSLVTKRSMVATIN